MRNFLTLIYVLIPFCCYSQFFDDFSESTLPDTKKWSGNHNHFIINTENQLQLFNTGKAATSYLSAFFEPKGAFTFECGITLKFNPSRYNFAKIYLMADQRDLSQPLNGLFLLLGGADDEISLFRQEGVKETRLISSKKRINDNTFNQIVCRVVRSDNGRWTLSSKVNEEKSFLAADPWEGDTETFPGNFGLLCTYSKTYSEKFLFDYFRFSTDTAPPPDENPEEETPPVGVGFLDVVISEVMANPKGITNLPEAEYVELYNRSSRDVDLSGCTFFYDTRRFVLPAYLLRSGARVILCHEQKAELFNSDIATIPIPSFATLANSGKLLLLENPDNELVSWVEYSDKWYGDSQKASGGFSLEMIDADNPLPVKSNWGASISEYGGTPGTPNSIENENTDNELPLLLSHSLNEYEHLVLKFSKPMDPVSLTAPLAFQASENVTLTPDVLRYPQSDLITLIPSRKASQLPFEVSPQDIKCVSALPLRPRLPLQFGKCESPEPGDMVINEILFNPPDPCTPYIELYNASDKILNLKELKIAQISSAGDIGTLYPIATESSFVSPREYVLVTCDWATLFKHYTYYDTPLIAIPARLTLSRTSGRIALLHGTDTRIDQLNYSEKLHTSKRSDLKGISLERISVEKESNDPSNWRSAAGYPTAGSPGYDNSAHPQSPESPFPPDESDRTGFWLPGEAVFLNQEDDHPLIIRYKLEQPDYTASFTTFNSRGILMGKPAVNITLAESGELQWGSEWYSERTPSPGIYILLIEYFNTKGDGKRIKLPFAVVP